MKNAKQFWVYNMRSFDELLKYSKVDLIEKSDVELCNTCKGLGTYVTEELVDYHKSDYETTRHICNVCNGDGRVVVTTRTVSMRPEKETSRVPYDTFVGNKFVSNYKSYGIKIDNRDARMEKNYPELAEITYEKYDEMLKQITINDKLAK